MVTAEGTASFTGGGSPVTLDPAVAVSDNSSSTLVSATVTITSGLLTGDTLSTTDLGGLSSSYSGGVLTLTGTASLDNYQAVLDDVTYSFTPSDGDPTDGGADTSRTIERTVSDGVLASSPATSVLATAAAFTLALSLLKLANGDTGVSIPVGAPVTWSYQVTNTGNVTLTNVSVTDSKVSPADIDCGGGSNVIASLAPGAEVTCTASGIAQQGIIYNRGTATGTPPSGPAVSSSSTADYLGFKAKVRLVKRTNGGDGLRIPVGSPVTWTYAVTNTGSKYAPLAEVTVTDNLVPSADIDCGSGTNVIASLNAGASVTCTASGTAIRGKYTNLGTVTARPRRHRQRHEWLLRDPASTAVRSLRATKLRVITGSV